MNITFYLYSLFTFFSIANIISVKKSNKLGKCLTKPFLMPLLLLIYLSGTSSPKWTIIFGIAFGFLGDIFLMPSGIFFTVGLFSFLIGHFFYIIALMQPIYKIPLVLYIFILPYVLYGIYVYSKLLPYINSIKFQAFLYLTAILTMSLLSFLRGTIIKGYEFWLPFIGSILFIASDTMLAFNLFKPKTKDMRIYIMLTYIIAELLIVSGFM
jgi:uncharacterized membrane protein YhhN